MNSCAALPQKTKSSRIRAFWHDRVLGLIIAQFRQGITAHQIALTITLAVCLGIFPILGATTALCAIVGVSLKLNQPVIQLFNWLIAPLQLSLILVFVRIGEWFTRSPQVSFSVPELMRKFHESPVKFMQQFGLTGLHGILAWSIIAPLLGALLYYLLLPPLRKLAAFTVAKHILTES